MLLPLLLVLAFPQDKPPAKSAAHRRCFGRSTSSMMCQ